MICRGTNILQTLFRVKTVWVEAITWKENHKTFDVHNDHCTTITVCGRVVEKRKTSDQRVFVPIIGYRNCMQVRMMNPVRPNAALITSCNAERTRVFGKQGCPGGITVNQIRMKFYVLRHTSLMCGKCISTGELRYSYTMPKIQLQIRIRKALQWWGFFLISFGGNYSEKRFVLPGKYLCWRVLHHESAAPMNNLWDRKQKWNYVFANCCSLGEPVVWKSRCCTLGRSLWRLRQICRPVVANKAEEIILRSERLKILLSVSLTVDSSACLPNEYMNSYMLW